MKKVVAFFMQVLLVILLLPSAVYAAPAENGQEITISVPARRGSHGWAYGACFGDIGKYNYIEEEYILSGTAQRCQHEGELTEDGMWTLEATDTAPYKTRFIVRRPVNPDKFNGIVIVEWANVSAGYDLSLVSTSGIYEEGFAYVSVMTQRNGIYGFAENPQGLIYWDEERYGSLDIPDDGLSYDIFTQAARAVGPDRPQTGIDPMADLM